MGTKSALNQYITIEDANRKVVRSLDNDAQILRAIPNGSPLAARTNLDMLTDPDRCRRVNLCRNSSTRNKKRNKEHVSSSEEEEGSIEALQSIF